jgi:hypothetical protein
MCTKNKMSKHGANCILCDKPILTAEIKRSNVLALHSDASHLSCKQCFKKHINDYAMISLYGLNCPLCAIKIDVHEYANAVPLQ